MSQGKAPQAGGRLEEAALSLSRSSAAHAQNLIAAVLEELPEAMADLREVAAAVRRETGQHADDSPYGPGFLAGTQLLVKGVSDWVGKYHLESEIIWWTVGATVEAWSVGPDESRVVRAKIIRVPQPVPEPPVYRPESMTRGEYRAMIDAYMPRAEEAWRVSAEAAGEVVVHVRQRRVTSREDPLMHYRWLARYQSGWPKARIAKAFGRQPSTVRDALSALARSLGLRLREQEVGRPRRRA